MNQLHIFFDGKGDQSLTEQIWTSLYSAEDRNDYEIYSHDVNHWPSDIFAYALTAVIAQGHVSLAAGPQWAKEHLLQRNGSAHGQRFFILTVIGNGNPATERR